MTAAFSGASPVRRLDWVMLLAMGLLLLIGMAFVYSAGYAGDDRAALRLYRKQLLWIGVGCGAFLLFAATDYRAWTKGAWWLYAAGLVLLALVFVPGIGRKIYGARRWIGPPGGDWLLQPAEFMKLAFLFLLARLYGRPGRDPARWRYVGGALALALVPMTLIVKQPDLGTALIFVPMVGAVLFVAGVPRRVLGGLMLSGVLAVGLLLTAVLLPPKLGWSEEQQTHLLQRVGLSPYQRDRILVFLNSDLDPLGVGWNKAQSQIAVGSGQFWGKGYLNGTQKFLGFLPRTVAPNDFIFSVIAEEMGFLGAAVVLALFVVLLLAGVRTAAVAADRTGRLLCVGIVALLFGHIFVNVGMTIGLLPITGIPLPLISYGGTFMVGAMSALGVVQSVHLRGDWR